MADILLVAVVLIGIMALMYWYSEPNIAQRMSDGETLLESRLVVGHGGFEQHQCLTNERVVSFLYYLWWPIQTLREIAIEEIATVTPAPGMQESYNVQAPGGRLAIVPESWVAEIERLRAVRK